MSKMYRTGAGGKTSKSARSLDPPFPHAQVFFLLEVRRCKPSANLGKNLQ
ncbi:hypothetical protein KD146_13440 [Devosia sp. BSSL-BM10]|uniref:Uncharacterized protein n=1 Tax=Devosia litorisediminis TaxID=2829817 RepID=A0A942ECG8_9HYPH|nr:hypothetical protein [Devosia litorisediminis]MBS3849702.1 hypothetical protein [Devosia litorisediminis]